MNQLAKKMSNLTVGGEPLTDQDIKIICKNLMIFPRVLYGTWKNKGLKPLQEHQTSYKVCGEIHRKLGRKVNPILTVEEFLRELIEGKNMFFYRDLVNEVTKKRPVTLLALYAAANKRQNAVFRHLN